ncbi:MAG: M23 family metallopeptidase [Desulfovibrio sp.]|uniref:M23 family metallopeptidase n=1 Tax=Desulfovibrio sp. TaxID=885 RepID=UPI0039E59DE1
MLKKNSIPLILAMVILASGCTAKQPISQMESPHAPFSTALLVSEEKAVPTLRQKNKAKKASTTLHVKPAAGQLSSAYGKRKLGKKRVRQHKGIDLSAKRGSPVLASASGHVVFVGKKGAYGRVIEIDHGNGLTTRYAHLDNFAVRQGEKVTAGKKLGAVGRSGRTTGPNLHFEVLLDSKHVDPSLMVPWS